MARARRPLEGKSTDVGKGPAARRIRGLPQSEVTLRLPATGRFAGLRCVGVSSLSRTPGFLCLHGAGPTAYLPQPSRPSGPRSSLPEEGHVQTSMRGLRLVNNAWVRLEISRSGGDLRIPRNPSPSRSRGFHSGTLSSSFSPPASGRLNNPVRLVPAVAHVGPFGSYYTTDGKIIVTPELLNLTKYLPELYI